MSYWPDEKELARYRSLYTDEFLALESAETLRLRDSKLAVGSIERVHLTSLIAAVKLLNSLGLIDRKKLDARNDRPDSPDPPR